METTFGTSKSILVPTDFSDSCKNAILHAIELSKPFKGKVYILHVSESNSPDEATSMYAALEKIDELIDTLDYEFIEPIVKAGDIFTTINEVALAKQADLIILGTHGKKGIQKIFGSYALKVIDSTKMPVIVVQEKSIPCLPKAIVFPVDSEEEDRQKTSYAIQLAKIYKSKIYIFQKAEKIAANKFKAINTLRQIQAFMSQNGVQAEVMENDDTETDFPKLVINYSASIKADMILIMSDASSHFPIIGAKEEDFLFNSANIPVMCVTEKRYKSVRFSVTG